MSDDTFEIDFTNDLKTLFGFYFNLGYRVCHRRPSPNNPGTNINRRTRGKETVTATTTTFSALRRFACRFLSGKKIKQIRNQTNAIRYSACTTRILVYACMFLCVYYTCDILRRTYRPINTHLYYRAVYRYMGGGQRRENKCK